MTALRVATFNIRTGRARDGDNRWDLRRPVTIDAIRLLDADVLCLQEAQDFQVEEIARAMDAYGVYGRSRQRGRGGEHVPIFWKRSRLDLVESGDFWLSERPDEPGSVGWDAALPRLCTWARLREAGSSASLAVFNTHLDHVGVRARVEGARLLAARASSSGDPAIVAGDLNAAEDAEPLGVLRRSGFRDTHRDVDPHGPAGTFHGFTGVAKGAKIDYVLAGRHWHTLSSAVVTAPAGGPYPSDHFPVVASVGLHLGRSGPASPQPHAGRPSPTASCRRPRRAGRLPPSR